MPDPFHGSIMQIRVQTNYTDLTGSGSTTLDPMTPQCQTTPSLQTYRSDVSLRKGQKKYGTHVGQKKESGAMHIQTRGSGANAHSKKRDNPHAIQGSGTECTPNIVVKCGPHESCAPCLVLLNAQKELDSK